MLNDEFGQERITLMTSDRMSKDLRDRTKAFALRIIRMFSVLPTSRAAQVMGSQVLRSGTSVGAHYREACRSRSVAEFISKMEGGLQELDETAY
jgi:four helix bundle protein